MNFSVRGCGVCLCPNVRPYRSVGHSDTTSAASEMSERAISDTSDIRTRAMQRAGVNRARRRRSCERHSNMWGPIEVEHRVGVLHAERFQGSICTGGCCTAPCAPRGRPPPMSRTSPSHSGQVVSIRALFFKGRHRTQRHFTQDLSPGGRIDRMCYSPHLKPDSGHRCNLQGKERLEGASTWASIRFSARTPHGIRSLSPPPSCWGRTCVRTRRTPRPSPLRPRHQLAHTGGQRTARTHSKKPGDPASGRESRGAVRPASSPGICHRFDLLRDRGQLISVVMVVNTSWGRGSIVCCV